MSILAAFLWLLGGTVGFLLSYIMYMHYKHNWKRAPVGKPIPSMKQTPFFGNLLEVLPLKDNLGQFMLNGTRKHVRMCVCCGQLCVVWLLWRWMRQCFETQGNVYKMALFQLGPPFVVANDPAVIKHTLVTGFQDGRYGKGANFREQYFVSGESWAVSPDFLAHVLTVPPPATGHVWQRHFQLEW